MLRSTVRRVVFCRPLRPARAHAAEHREACGRVRTKTLAYTAASIGAVPKNDKDRRLNWQAKLNSAKQRTHAGKREGLPAEDLQRVGTQVAACLEDLPGGLPFGRLPPLMIAKHGVVMKELQLKGNYFSQKRMVEHAAPGHYEFIQDPASKTGDIILYALGKKPDGEFGDRLDLELASGGLGGAFPGSKPRAKPPPGPGGQLCVTAGCGRHPRSEFSVSQLRQPTAKRKCQRCVGTAGSIAVGAPAARPAILPAGGGGALALAAPQAISAVAVPVWMVPGARSEALYDDAWLPSEVTELPQPGVVRVTWEEDGSLSDLPYDQVRQRQTAL